MEGVLSICMATAVVLVVFSVVSYGRLEVMKAWWWTCRSKKKKRKLPVGSLGWPFIGETLDFISCAYSPFPESFMDKRRLLCGKVFKSHIFGSPTIVSTDPEVSKFFLQSNATAFVPFYPRSLTELMGKNSILQINGSLHKRVHGLVGSFLKSPHLKSQVTDDMHKYMVDSMSKWEDDQLIYIQDVSKHIVFQVLVRGLTSLEPGEDMFFLQQQFREFIKGLISLPVKIPGCRLYRSLQAKKRMVKIIKDIVREKRKNSNRSSPRDVIDVLLNDSSNKLTDDHISDNIIDFMIPGEDSVPTLITLAVKYLSDCPEALRQMEGENMKLKMKKARSGEKLSWADYSSLSFTQNVISETLRMGNIINGVYRKAMRDMEIKGHFIPKGWCVLAYFRSVHLDKDIYDDPHRFNPWRWQEKDIGGTSNFTPFGGGLRLCAGLDLARLEASIFLHHLVTNFRWVADADTIVSFPTVRMKGRMPIRVKRRETNIE